MRVSLIQLAVTDEETPSDRVQRAVKLVEAERDAGADLVVLPELWEIGGFSYDKWQAAAQPLSSSSAVAAIANTRGENMWLHAGSFLDIAPTGKLSNSSILFGPGGAEARYDKIHLFGFTEGEAALMESGTQIVTVPTPFGTFGLATCYDIRFPEQFRRLLDAGMEHLVICSCWPLRRIEHWRVLLRARAIEEQVFVFATNCVGTHGGVAMGGHSVVIDPWGNVITEGGTEEEVLRAEVDPALVAQTRETLPVLRDRRLG